ncbi:ATP-dependent helicase [Anaerobacillus sp. MEB173]|uniref:ATP-dependent helicase n=1 Tax=Anaerobacillus sp. MEB173 TaxID=3383345 RepID=UPI003F904C52
MHIARYSEQIINLKNYERSSFQELYHASIRGQVKCINCDQPLRLRIGIFGAPDFQHPPSQVDCYSVTDKWEHEQKTSPKTTNKAVSGFTLPERRAIQSETIATIEKTKQWIEPQPITGIPTFEPVIDYYQPDDDPFYEKLQSVNYSLDEAQWESVRTTEGPLLILAGAGSGKTRVLTARTAYMMTEKKIPANRLLLVTFTTKAAREMKERMLLYPGLSKKQLQQLVTGTFHSIFYKMLLHHQPEKWQPNKLLKWDWQRDQLLKEAGREIELDEKEFAYDQALSQIGLWKNNMLSPKQVKAKDLWEERVLYLYTHYEERKESIGSFDFDDMLLGCYELLFNDPKLLAKYQQRFSYMLVDEFQDINKIQYEIIKMLAAETRNLCAVGDDDQSIYGFRGSDPTYILNFKKDYTEAKTVVLNRNYRSGHSIVSAAGNVIVNNTARMTKHISAIHNESQVPLLFYPYDEEEEATMIVTDIKERIEQGSKPEDFAILYRTNVASRAIFERLVHSNLPFVIEQDGDSFYHRKTVKKVLAFLRLGLNPEDTKAMSDLLSALFLKQSVLQDLKAISITADCTMVEALTKLTTIKPFQLRKLKEIVPQFKQLTKLSTVAAIDLIEKKMGLQDYLKKQGNEGNIMDRGSDDVRDLKVAAKSYPTIMAFLEHIDHIIAKSNERKQTNTQHQSGIQLMTVHRSKGLEFKHVYLLSAVDGSLPHDYALEAWRDGENLPLEEERRLTYVAITRAKESIYISIPQNRRGKKAYRSRFIREMGKQSH